LILPSVHEGVAEVEQEVRFVGRLVLQGDFVEHGVHSGIPAWRVRNPQMGVGLDVEHEGAAGIPLRVERVLGPLRVVGLGGDTVAEPIVVARVWDQSADPDLDRAPGRLRDLYRLSGVEARRCPVLDVRVCVVSRYNVQGDRGVRGASEDLGRGERVLPERGGAQEDEQDEQDERR
jgi:hypothetical protein